MLTSSAFPSSGADLLGHYSAQLCRLRDRSLAELAALRGHRLEQMDVLMRGIVQESFDGVLAFDALGRVQLANEAAAAMFGWTREALHGRSFAALFPDFERFKAVPCPSARPDGGRFEGLGLRRDGGRFPVELSLRHLRLGEEALLVGIVRDISERKRQERRLRHLALHDPLTGLANRLMLHECLVRDLARARRENLTVALLLVDLDRFKEVNDTLGHDVGDVLLREFARRLATCTREADTVGRLGGDEFAILLAPGTDREAALGTAERIVLAVRQPFALTSEALVEIGVSIGIALAPLHADHPTTLLRFADVAMYAAKRGPDPIELYDRAKDRHNLRTLALTGALRRAIEEDDLRLHYQPKLDLRTGLVCGVEALVRWHHPEHGLIMPSEFVPQAEHTGIIHELARWTLEAGLRQVAEWRAAGLILGVAINLSSRSLHHEHLPELVHSLLARHAVEPGLLTIEVTESAMVHDIEAVSRVLQRLLEQGVRLSVDDFGTGYSSLAMLQRLSVQELKVDASFVRGMLDNEQDLVIVRSTVELAHNLGLTAVAEGVETEAQARALQSLGCDLAQGYLISEPIGGQALLELLRGPRWRGRASRPALGEAAAAGPA